MGVSIISPEDQVGGSGGGGGLTDAQLRASPVVTSGYDSGDDMMKVKSVQKKWRDSFVGSALNAAKWDSATGTGGAITVGSGVLTLGSGTTASAETYVLSKETFTIPFRVNIGLTLSQRIANQTFLVEAISVNPSTLVPDGLHTVALLFDGTTATQAKYRVQNSGATPLDSSAVTFPTTASGGFYELEPFSDEAWFHGGTLDSTSGRANSYRRHQQIPEPTSIFKIRLRWLNGSSVPASNTNAVIQYITVQDYAELTAEITAGRGQTVAGQGVGVNVIGTVPVSLATNTPTLAAGTNLACDVGFQYRANATGAAGLVAIMSPATNAAASIKASAGRLIGWQLQNSATALRSVKIFNATAVTLGTTSASFEIDIPAGGRSEFNLPGGMIFGTGIMWSCSAAKGLTDNTSGVALNDVSGTIYYA